MNHIDFIATCLAEIQTAINDIEEFTNFQTQESFVIDKLRHKAVAKSFEQIGESANKIQKISPEFIKKHTYIAWSDMYKFRNVLVHDYMGVNPNRVWHIIIDYLPHLKDSMEQLLKEETELKKLVDIGVQAYNATWRAIDIE